ncbi:MAG: hypothetical protein HQK87_11070 [Nitrospinae bacterium]|nr:hypothetical protein [Nitrospinota bacterium]
MIEVVADSLQKERCRNKSRENERKRRLSPKKKRKVNVRRAWRQSAQREKVWNENKESREHFKIRYLWIIVLIGFSVKSSDTLKKVSKTCGNENQTLIEIYSYHLIFTFLEI